MNKKHIEANGLMLITAAIWGFAFVAQRLGMQHVGPFIFNAIRFAIGGLVLLPFWWLQRKRPSVLKPSGKDVLRSGFAAGTMLFFGASLQQMGMVYTTAGNAGFITGFYVIFVPIMGMLWGLKTDTGTWLGAILAVIGMYFLSVTADFSVSFGDALVLASAFFWAGHVHVIGFFTHKIPSIQLAAVQFFVCALYSLMAAFIFETNTLPAIFDAALPLLYAGLLSTGVAYTLQVVAQKNAHPAHAAIILSLEAVFALLGGWLLLGEKMSSRGLFGGGLMLAGMIFSQIHSTYKLAKK